MNLRGPVIVIDLNALFRSAPVTLAWCAVVVVASIAEWAGGLEARVATLSTPTGEIYGRSYFTLATHAFVQPGLAALVLFLFGVLKLGVPIEKAWSRWKFAGFAISSCFVSAGMFPVDRLIPLPSLGPVYALAGFAFAARFGHEEFKRALTWKEAVALLVVGFGALVAQARGVPGFHLVATIFGFSFGVVVGLGSYRSLFAWVPRLVLIVFFVPLLIPLSWGYAPSLIMQAGQRERLIEYVSMVYEYSPDVAHHYETVLAPDDWISDKPEDVPDRDPFAHPQEISSLCREGAFACFKMARTYLLTSEEAYGAHALNLFTAACESDSSDSCFAGGLIQMNGSSNLRNFARSRAMLGRGCELGHPNACRALGDLAESGLGGPVDAALAVASHQKACDLKDWSGCHALGVLHHRGLGVQKDDTRAAELYQLACENGYAHACADAGVRFIHGRGVKQDRAHGVRLLEIGCEGEAPAPCFQLAQELKKGSDEDKRKANSYLERSCAQGYALACESLGNALLQLQPEESLSADSMQYLERAVATFREGCEFGDGRDCKSLARYYELGRVVAKDPERAATLRRRACELDQRTCD